MSLRSPLGKKVSRSGAHSSRARTSRAPSRAERTKKTTGSKRTRRRLSAKQRRVRALLILAVAFAALVLGTSLPVSELVSQHRQLSSTSEQLEALDSQNAALQQEEKELENPSVIAEIARRDYGLVPPGSEAYEVLPASGSSSDAAQSTGHVPLDGPPVVPGSAQSQALIGAGEPATDASTTGETASSSGSAHDARSPGAARSDGTGLGSDGGFWTRVAHSLEFWR